MGLTSRRGKQAKYRKRRNTYRRLRGGESAVTAYPENLRKAKEAAKDAFSKSAFNSSVTAYPENLRKAKEAAKDTIVRWLKTFIPAIQNSTQVQLVIIINNLANCTSDNFIYPESKSLEDVKSNIINHLSLWQTEYNRMIDSAKTIPEITTKQKEATALLCTERQHLALSNNSNKGKNSSRSSSLSTTNGEAHELSSIDGGKYRRHKKHNKQTQRLKRRS